MRRHYRWFYQPTTATTIVATATATKMDVTFESAHTCL
jgi:hypothetical protein